MEERDCWYILAETEGLSPLALRKLTAYFGSAEAAVREEQWPLGDMLREAVRKRISEASHLLQERDAWEKAGIHWCCPADASYPERLKELSDAPGGLYYRGKLPEEERSAGIVGARSCSVYGETMAARFGEALAREGFAVVSGMALGVDGYAQRGALKSGGHSYAVLGCGADICYPAANRKLYEELAEKGGLISEYRPGTTPQSWHFPQRNRLISALSDVLLVIEAREKSGSLITVDQALEQGKEVMALPGRVDDELSRGCNALIRQGAGILTSVSDVLELFGLEIPAEGRKKGSRSLPSLTKQQRKLWELLSSTPRHTEELAAAADMSFGELAVLLLELEQMGLVRAAAGGLYVRV